MERERINELLAYGAVLWPRTFTLPADETRYSLTVQVWQDVLGDLDPTAIRAAMADWLGKFPPTPRELRQATIAISRLIAGDTPAPDVDEALAELERAVHLVGYMGRPGWSHPAITDAVRSVGGWADGICHTTNPAATRAHFITAYTAAVSRHRDHGSPAIPILAAATARAELDGPQRIHLEELGKGPS